MQRWKRGVTDGGRLPPPLPCPLPALSTGPAARSSDPSDNPRCRRSHRTHSASPVPAVAMAPSLPLRLCPRPPATGKTSCGQDFMQPRAQPATRQHRHLQSTAGPSCYFTGNILSSRRGVLAAARRGQAAADAPLCGGADRALRRRRAAREAPNPAQRRGAAAPTAPGRGPKRGAVDTTKVSE